MRIFIYLYTHVLYVRSKPRETEGQVKHRFIKKSDPVDRLICAATVQNFRQVENGEALRRKMVH